MASMIIRHHNSVASAKGPQRIKRQLVSLNPVICELVRGCHESTKSAASYGHGASRIG